jgi:ribonuclease R
VNILALRSLEIATYSPASIGHYALAASKYCHFTSPIRRYADLMVHRALQSYLTGQLERARRLYAFPDLEEIGQHLSETEQTAEEAEQELKTILVLHLLRKQVGQELTGIVVNLTAFGASVHLPEFGVEGLIPREALGPDHWQFDEQSQCLVGRYTGAILRLAQTLRVRIVGVHPAAAQLDLAPAHPLMAKVPGQNQQQKSRRKHPQRHRRGPKNR